MNMGGVKAQWETLTQTQTQDEVLKNTTRMMKTIQAEKVNKFWLNNLFISNYTIKEM